MDSSELIGLVGFGPNAALVAALGGDASWNVASDWGFDDQWKVEHAPVGIKFRRLTNGLVSQEVLITRGQAHERTTHERLLTLARVPAKLVFVERPDARHNRFAPHYLSQSIGRDS